MLDIKVIAIKDILVVDEVGFVPNFSPRTLDIRGIKLLKANEVYVNSFPVPEFIIVSDTKILAQVPNSQLNTTITSVTVLSTKPSVDRSSFLHFEVGKTISSLQGLEKLVQLFTKMLIQTPGSDRFHPDEGGGLLKLVGSNVGKNQGKSLSASLVSAVNRTRDQLMMKQSGITRIHPDERLLRADVQAVGYNPNTTTLVARISVGAYSGRQAVANLTF